MENNQNIKKSFWKDKKNVAIVILSALLLLNPFGQTDNASEISKLKTKISSLETTISTLENQNTNLKTKNDTLEQEKKELENENQRLAQENSQLKETKTISQQESTNINVTTPPTSSSELLEATETTQLSESNSEMVWVGNTGTKYHKHSCRTLKGNGQQITLKQALSEGRQACKVCY